MAPVTTPPLRAHRVQAVVRCFPFPNAAAAFLACRLWRGRLRARRRGSSLVLRRVEIEVGAVEGVWNGLRCHWYEEERRAFEWR